MIDKAAIFEAILSKNALRRKAGLPEWPVRETYEKEVRDAAWREHAEEHGARVRAEVLSRQRAKFGPAYPQSAGGRMALSCMVGKALREDFSRSAFARRPKTTTADDHESVTELRRWRSWLHYERTGEGCCAWAHKASSPGQID